MKKLNLLFIVSLFLLSFSCSDNDDMTVIIDQAGTLTVKVMDEDKPIGNAEVNIYYHEPGMVIEEGYTDAFGVFEAGKLIQNLYSCYVYAERNGITYTDEKSFQILAGNHKNIELNPYSNIGNVSFQVFKYRYYDSRSVFPDANVILIPYSHYWSYQTLSERIANADFKGKTDQNGWVKFTEVPAGRQYIIVIYKDNYMYEIRESYYFHLYRGEDGQRELNVYDYY